MSFGLIQLWFGLLVKVEVLVQLSRSLSCIGRS